jgi:class 3 adenylate cyclase
MPAAIRYCTTSDGVRIAYWTTGSGPPFLHFPMGVICDIQQELAQPEIVRWYEMLASRYTLVRYDARGFGSSQRDISAVSLDSILLDTEAVVTALELEEVTAFGGMIYGAIAVVYAARQPDLVRRVVAWNPHARFNENLVPSELTVLDDLIKKDWKTFTNASMQRQWGWSRADQAARWAKLLSGSTSPETYTDYVATFKRIDIGPNLSQVTVPALVVKHRRHRVYSGDNAAEFASRIPDAQFVTLDGPDFMPWMSHAAADEAFPVVTHFVDGEAASIPSAPSRRTEGRTLRTVLFTDIVGHTEMMQRLGDAKGRDVLREHERITRETLKQHGGAEVKTMGDGFMASFASVTKAMDCAIALQRAFATHKGEPLQVRVGLNAGEPIEEDGDLFGSTVIMASRVAAQAGAGEILIPEPLRHLLTGKSYVYADRGETVLKGFEDAVRLYEVRWQP